MGSILGLRLLGVDPATSAKVMTYVACPRDMIMGGTARSQYIDGCSNGFLAEVSPRVISSPDQYDRIIQDFCSSVSSSLRQNSMLRPVTVGVSVDGYAMEEYSVDQAFFELKKTFRYEPGPNGQLMTIETPIQGLRFSALDNKTDARIHAPVVAPENIDIPQQVEYSESPDYSSDTQYGD